MISSNNSHIDDIKLDFSVFPNPIRHDEDSSCSRVEIYFIKTFNFLPSLFIASYVTKTTAKALSLLSVTQIIRTSFWHQRIKYEIEMINGGMKKWSGHLLWVEILICTHFPNECLFF
jgi:hypothetical protein